MSELTFWKAGGGWLKVHFPGLPLDLHLEKLYHIFCHGLKLKAGGWGRMQIISVAQAPPTWHPLSPTESWDRRMSVSEGSSWFRGTKHFLTDPGQVSGGQRSLNQRRNYLALQDTSYIMVDTPIRSLRVPKFLCQPWWNIGDSLCLPSQQYWHGDDKSR